MVLESILADSYQIHFNEKGFDFLNELLKEKKYSKVFILTDSNTNAYCLPVLLADIVGDYPFEIIEIEAGEEYKNLETCQQVWMALSDLGGDRKSVLLNFRRRSGY
ncbi:3-dehydroquinate synthase (fragment) [Capnocytophaga canimorsus]